MITPEVLARFEALLEPGSLRLFSADELDELRRLNYPEFLLRHMLPLATDEYRGAVDADFQIPPVSRLIEWCAGSSAARLIGCWPFAEGCNGDMFAFDLLPDPTSEDPPVVRLSHDVLPFDAEELLPEWTDEELLARFELSDDPYDALDQVAQFTPQQQRELAEQLRHRLHEGDERAVELIGHTFAKAVEFWANEKFRTGE